MSRTPLTLQEIVRRAKLLYPDKNYDYSKSIYNGYNEMMKVRCPIHGEFEILVSSHLSERDRAECHQCNIIEQRKKYGMGKNEFVRRANLIHNNKYTYEKMDYVNWKTSLKITCPIHGDFMMMPYSHLDGGGCLKCRMERTKNSKYTDKHVIVCAVCGDRFKTTFGLAGHISVHNLTNKEYYDKYMKKQNDGKCIMCGDPTRFISMTRGYTKHCDKRICSNNDPESIKKREETCLKLYGVKDANLSSVVQENKRKKCIEKYGVDHPMKNKEIANKTVNTKLEKYGKGLKEINHRAKQTFLKNYGVDNPSKIPEIIEKSKQSRIEKYGNATNGKKISLTRKKKYIAQLEEKIKDMGYTVVDFGTDLGNDFVKMKCDKGHEFELTSKLIWSRLDLKNTLCTVCNPIESFSSGDQDKLSEFIREIYGGTVLDRVCNVIKGELDVYLPHSKIAFEYNGIYWHSDLMKDKNYHLNKTEQCNKLGIRLIHIFEDQWRYKRKIIESMIKNMLGVTEDRIFARKCIIKEVDDRTLIENFYNNNHLQGNVVAKHNIGLFYQNELVSLMSFSKSKLNKNYEYELVRFANKLNTSVVGSASRLFTYFIRTINPNTIISYADKCWSIGGVYEKLGFINTYDSKPSYFYVDKNGLVRQHRFKFRKSELFKVGYSKFKTEDEIMKEDNRYFRLWDCGKKVFVWSQDVSK